jgi:hypothetical protein
MIILITERGDSTALNKLAYNFLSVISLFLVIFNLGCEASHTVPLKDLDPKDRKPVPEVLDFASVSEAVFTPHCIRCHSTASGNQGGVNLETYAAVKPIIGLVQEVIVDGSMPIAAPLSEELKSIVVDWVTAGAPEKLEPEAFN